MYYNSLRWIKHAPYIALSPLAPSESDVFTVVGTEWFSGHTH